MIRAVRELQRGPAARRHGRRGGARASSRSVAGSRSTRSGSACRAGASRLPSSLVMAAVPALVAGVRRIAVVTPRPVDVTLVVARELGLDEVYAVGGAQAVAALAYGTESIASVDRIVGPGNAYVTAAKLLVSSRVGIDLPAGPSEVVVIADETADADACAADLLAQAEHGADSEALLLSTDPGAVRAPSLRLLLDMTTSPSRRLPRSARRWRAPRRSRPSTSSCTSATRRRCSRAFATPARCSSAARPSSATTRPVRRTSCRRAASRAPPAASGSRCS